MNADIGKVEGGTRTAESAEQTKQADEVTRSGNGQTGSAPTKRTNTDIHAAFVTVFGDVAKAKREAERITAAKRLKPYRQEVLKLRAAGFSWRKIAIGMRKPPIAVPATPESLKATFGKAEAASQRKDILIKPTQT